MGGKGSKRGPRSVCRPLLCLSLRVFRRSNLHPGLLFLSVYHRPIAHLHNSSKAALLYCLTPLHTTTRYTSISFASPFASTIDLSRPFIRRVHSQSLAVHGTHPLAADVTAAYSVAFAHCPSSPLLPLPYSHNLVLPSLLDPTC